MSETSKLLPEQEGVLPLTFAFHHLRYSIQAKKESKVLLDDVSGIIKPGTVLAIMGPSGKACAIIADQNENRLLLTCVLQGPERRRCWTLLQVELLEATWMGRSH